MSQPALPSKPDPPPSPPGAGGSLAPEPQAPMPLYTVSGLSPIRHGWRLGLSICVGLLLATLAGIFFYRLTWFLLALYLSFIAATILEAPVHWLTRHHIRRGFAAALVCLGALALVGTLLYFIAVGMIDQSSALTAKLAQAPQRIESMVNGLRRHFPGISDGIPRFDFKSVMSRALPDLSTLWNHAMSSVEVISLLVIMFFLMLYMLIDGPDHLKAMRGVLPKNSRLEATQVFRAVSHAHRGWAFASCANVCSATILLSTGLYLIGIPGAILLGLIAGLGELIPNIGPLLGAMPALLLTLLAEPDRFFYVVGMFIVLQTIQSYTITPLMLRFSVQLPVLVTIISVVVFGTLFGFLGIVVAIPLVADMVVVWNYIASRREKDATDYDAVNAPANTPRAVIGPDRSLPRLKALLRRSRRPVTR